ncbi:ASCH domain-containing protein [Streptomyces sp. NPDC057908]|uniref:ASCH domain-containing protein n=1 Tax=Streptomyces sp. NPDC057908 TaxID=3346276 RepID=UPI0036EDE7FB
MDSDLYPDPTAAGSLAAALEQLAAELGVDLTVVPGDWGPLVSAGIASSAPERKPLSVHIGAESRWFGVSGWSRGVELITGATPDLADVVRAGAAWGRGRSLRELRAELSFLRSSKRAKAHERGLVTTVGTSSTSRDAEPPAVQGGKESYDHAKASQGPTNCSDRGGEIMWPRVNGMRALELGIAGDMRAELNSLVLAGRKTATTCLLDEYAEETEGLEYVGERQTLLDNEGRSIATLEYTGVEVKPFAEVTWEHAEAEGEGDASLEDWRDVHRRFWDRAGTPVKDHTVVVCLAFRVVGCS